MQAVSDAHDTDFREAYLAPAGEGTRWSDQLPPFQPIASGPSEDPTAVQAVNDAHDTPAARMPPLGVGWTDHLLPFQRSTSPPTAVQAVGDAHDTPLNPPTPTSDIIWLDQVVPSQRAATTHDPREFPGTPPTALQAIGDAHDTPVMTLPALPGKVERWIDHRLPFQRAASMLRLPSRPTAVQTVVDAHDTAVSLPLAPAGLGDGWIDHLLPFQRSTRFPSASYPTVVQALGDAHDTPVRSPPVTGLESRWIDQPDAATACVAPASHTTNAKHPATAQTTIRTQITTSPPPARPMCAGETTRRAARRRPPDWSAARINDRLSDPSTLPRPDADARISARPESMLQMT